MGKKKDKKRPKLKPEKKDNPVPLEKDGSFDFGGLPDRNLKKNLGCG
jgi:hypothetical protein